MSSPCRGVCLVSRRNSAGSASKKRDSLTGITGVPVVTGVDQSGIKHPASYVTSRHMHHSSSSLWPTQRLSTPCPPGPGPWRRRPAGARLLLGGPLHSRVEQPPGVVGVLLDPSLVQLPVEVVHVTVVRPQPLLPLWGGQGLQLGSGTEIGERSGERSKSLVCHWG